MKVTRELARNILRELHEIEAFEISITIPEAAPSDTHGAEEWVIDEIVGVLLRAIDKTGE